MRRGDDGDGACASARRHGQHVEPSRFTNRWRRRWSSFFGSGRNNTMVARGWGEAEPAARVRLRDAIFSAVAAKSLSGEISSR